MVGGEAALEVRVLHRHGKGIREIAREVGSSRNTVRRYLRDESAARYKPRPPRATKLDLFKDYVVERLTSAAPERIPASVRSAASRTMPTRAGLYGYQPKPSRKPARARVRCGAS